MDLNIRGRLRLGNMGILLAAAGLVGLSSCGNVEGTRRGIEEIITFLGGPEQPVSTNFRSPEVINKHPLELPVREGSSFQYRK